MAAKDNAYEGGRAAGGSGSTAAPKQQGYILQKASDAGFNHERQRPQPKPEPKPKPVCRADGKR